MNCPRCNLPLTEAEIRSLWGSLTSSKRKTRGGNPKGRPRVVQPRSEPSKVEPNAHVVIGKTAYPKGPRGT